MANIHTGELRPWDDLTPEQQQSGEWIKVPDGTEGGRARSASLLDRVFAKRNPAAEKAAELAQLRRQNDSLHEQLRGFDAVGKPTNRST